MQPNPSYLNRSSQFWALAKYISESLGYSKKSTLRTFELKEIEELDGTIFSDSKTILPVVDYLNFRADLIANKVQPLLMNREEAKSLFEGLIKNYKPKCALTYNKQKGDKKHLNYLTCMVNVLAEQNLTDSCNFSPRQLCTVTDKNDNLIATLSRWMDGAYPSTHNPKAIWEIKEYYGTTTFGSRVADGVYETQLDGHEILEAEKVSGKKIKHYLFVDDKFTWWDCGKSYLCRLIDMMHMGLVDEVIFGKEVVTRWPAIIKTFK